MTPPPTEAQLSLDFDAKPEPTDWRKEVPTVSQLTRRVRGHLESAFVDVWVRGEVSNFRKPVSGHAYFCLKDASAQLKAVMRPLIDRTAPGLLSMYGVGHDVAAKLLVAAGDNPDRLRSEAAFANLCGVAPLEASSGKTVRHRLNRGGNRQANKALYHVVITRMASHPPTKTYITRRRADPKPNRVSVSSSVAG